MLPVTAKGTLILICAGQSVRKFGHGEATCWIPACRKAERSNKGSPPTKDTSLNLVMETQESDENPVMAMKRTADRKVIGKKHPVDGHLPIDALVNHSPITSRHQTGHRRKRGSGKKKSKVLSKKEGLELVPRYDVISVLENATVGSRMISCYVEMPLWPGKS